MDELGKVEGRGQALYTREACARTTFPRSCDQSTNPLSASDRSGDEPAAVPSGTPFRRNDPVPTGAAPRVCPKPYDAEDGCGEAATRVRRGASRNITPPLGRAYAGRASDRMSSHTCHKMIVILRFRCQGHLATMPLGHTDLFGRMVRRESR